MVAKKSKKTESPVARQFRSMPAADPYEMTDDEIRLQMARDNLAKYGTTIAPISTPMVAESPELAKAKTSAKRERKEAVAETEEQLFAGPRKPKAISPKWFAMEKKCPHCGKTKNVAADFGVVIRRGLEQSAGWCKQCRSETDYRKLPRKYNVGQ